MLLVLAATLAGAQSLVLDTTYVVSNGASFTQVKEKKFDDGRERREYIPYDTVQITSLYWRLHQDRCEEVTQSALAAIARQRTVKQLRDYDQGLAAITGISLSDSIARSLYDVHLRNRTLELDSAGVVTTVQINPRAAGGYNLRISGTNYRLDIFDKRWVRARNFPRQGIDTDLWLYRGEYVSFDGAYTLRDASGNNIRSAAPAPAESTPAPAPKKTTTRKQKKQ